MIRVLSVPLLFAFACLLSGVYGALHNQISFTVSPEYFTKFKFDQFQISPHFYDRFGTAIVGSQASWWMGLIIGVFLIPAGMLVRDTRGYIFAVMKAFFAVLSSTVVTGLTALLIAYWFLLVRILSSVGDGFSKAFSLPRPRLVINTKRWGQLSKTALEY